MKISILTPNYNYAHFIGQTIQSVIDQNYSNFEYIIVDDGSTDNSVEVINKFVGKYPDKIKLIQQENKGQTNAINKALNNVTGDIIVWINSDDKFNSGAFNTIVASFEKYPEVDAIFGDIIIINHEGHKIKRNNYLKFDYASGVFNGFGKIISSNAIFWRANLSKEIEPFNEEFKISMDSEYWSRLLYKKKLKHIDFALASFRWHVEAKTIKRNDKSNKEYDYGLAENKMVFLNSYKNLTISKILPANYTLALRYYYKIKRLLLRFLNGHYSSKA